MKPKLFVERGQALILIALAAVGLFGMTGLAIDGGMVFSDRRNAQNAADTAALAGALGCTWGHMLCSVIAVYILIEGLGAHVDFWLTAGLWSLAYFVTLVPISINGYGVQLSDSPAHHGYP